MFSLFKFLPAAQCNMAHCYGVGFFFLSQRDCLFQLKGWQFVCLRVSFRFCFPFQVMIDVLAFFSNILVIVQFYMLPLVKITDFLCTQLICKTGAGVEACKQDDSPEYYFSACKSGCPPRLIVPKPAFKRGACYF